MREIYSLETVAFYISVYVLAVKTIRECSKSTVRLISGTSCIYGNLWFVWFIDFNVKHCIFQSINFSIICMECPNTPEINLS